MNRKTKIIVSVVGITIVLLALLGITYAYYLTRIEGNTNTNSISVTTADLKLRYDDGTSKLVTSDNFMPGMSITKDFSVSNEGESRVDNYAIVLENVVNGLDRQEDLTFTLDCKLADKITSCGGTFKKQFPATTNNYLIFKNSIDKDVIHYYTLTVTYANLDEDQSDDMGKTFSALVNIKDGSQFPNVDYARTEGTLAYTLLSSYGGADEITDISEGDSFSYSDVDEFAGMYITEDDYGNSYYYRGMKGPTVKFAQYDANSEVNGTTYNEDTLLEWQIIRINGDGSIRISLKQSIGWSPFYDDNLDSVEMKLGYMYGTSENPYLNTNDSVVKHFIDNWYNSYLKEYYEVYISDSIFCNDRSFTENNNYLSSKYRIEDIIIPSLKCKQQNDRFTVNDEVNGNGDLINPIGMLTADEVVFAGFNWNDYDDEIYNSKYIFFDWTLTPAYYEDNESYKYVYFYNSYEDYSTNPGDVDYSVFPVINLKANVPFTIDEDGTYVITTN